MIVLLLFGATKLPALAKSVGQSAKIFKSEMKTGVVEDGEEAPAATPGGTVGGLTYPQARVRSILR